MSRTDDRVAGILKWLERRGTKKNRDGMARYGIVSPHAFGLPVAGIRDLGKRLGRDHELALALLRSIGSRTLRCMLPPWTLRGN